jgi:amidase
VTPQWESTTTPDRRQLLRTGLLGAFTAAASAPARAWADTPPAARTREIPPSELDELTIGQLQEGMTAGRYSAHALVEKFLARIAALDTQGPSLHAIIEQNPEALALAEALDRERKTRGPRGPLHGIPILIKDNIDTADRMATTAGSLALVGSRPPHDAFVVCRLREAGAVLLGKSNLSEWANIRSSHSTSGWSGRGGLTRNPYALDRNPSGSSSGSAVAVAANFCAAAVGTETDGSIVSPSSTCGLVGIKPTVGLVSRAGIIPISHTQDTAGPMARTVRDAALLLGILAGVDAEDGATTASRDHSVADYTRYLDPKGLRGARLGIVRKFFGFNDHVDALMEEALGVLKREGATLLDPVSVPTLSQLEDAEGTVLHCEFKTGLNAYLARLGPSAPVHSLEEVIRFNEQNRRREMPYFGQDTFLKAQAEGPLTSKKYLEALEKIRRLARREGIDAIMAKQHLDALVVPTEGPAWMTDLVDGDHSSSNSTTPAAVAGYPHITVPAGFVFGLPVGISFFGSAWSEPTLLRLAYAFEQATRARKPPRFLPAADARV